MKRTILGVTMLAITAVGAYFGYVEIRERYFAPRSEAVAQANDEKSPLRPIPDDAAGAPRLAPTTAWHSVTQDDRYAAQADVAESTEVRGQQPAEVSEVEPQRLPVKANPVRAGQPTSVDPFAARTAPAVVDIPDAGETAREVVEVVSRQPVSQAGDEADNFAPPAEGRYEPSNEGSAADVAPPASQRQPTVATAPSLGAGTPGKAELEGMQSPQLTVQKTAPAEVQVGKPAAFVIKVKNVGSATAHDVRLMDELPRGMQFVSAKPEPTESNGMLTWDLGALSPGQESTVQMELNPTAEGELGSVASVSFRAEASVRTKATKPQLVVKATGPEKVMIGQQATIHITVSNPGTGAAASVVLTEAVPAGFKHAGGKELELEVGALAPGETREFDLTLDAVEAGTATNMLSAKGDANLQADDRMPIEVIAPALKVELTGPKKRYLERSATYNISVSNPGTAPAKDIELVSVLPKGLQFVEANNAGQYDAATHSVYWSLDELPASETGNVTMTALPIEPGELKLRIKGQAKQGLTDEHEETISVDGLAAILFELVDVNDPIEVGGETTYEVRVINQGSKEAKNVRLVAVLPAEMEFVSTESPVKHTVDGQRVLFEPLHSLAPKADTTYSFKVKGKQPGDLRVRVQLISDEIRTPITKEESTRVYADE